MDIEDTYTVRMHRDGESIVDYEPVSGNRAQSTYNAATTSASMMPSPRGITVDMHDEHGNVIASVTF